MRERLGALDAQTAVRDVEGGAADHLRLGAEADREPAGDPLLLPAIAGGTLCHAFSALRLDLNRAGTPAPPGPFDVGAPGASEIPGAGQRRGRDANIGDPAAVP